MAIATATVLFLLYGLTALFSLKPHLKPHLKPYLKPHSHFYDVGIAESGPSEIATVAPKERNLRL